MATDPGTRTAPGGKPTGGKRDNVFTRKIGPLPAWVWMAIAAALVLLYVLWKGHSSSSSPSSGSGGKGTATNGAQVPPVVEQETDDDGDTDRDRHRRRKHGGGGKKKEGPEREWLEHKTGSEHPWTYLARHHETIKVGPHGSRKIVSGSDPRRRRHRRDHDEATENTATATRAVPGQPPSGATGSLVSFTVPSSGPAPSLAQVAAQYNTAPDAIVEEATGRGSPHGALWRRYVAANDWQAPLPHGTDMTILAQPN